MKIWDTGIEIKGEKSGVDDFLGLALVLILVQVEITCGTHLSHNLQFKVERLKYSFGAKI